MDYSCKKYLCNHVKNILHSVPKEKTRTISKHFPQTLQLPACLAFVFAVSFHALLLLTLWSQALWSLSSTATSDPPCWSLFLELSSFLSLNGWYLSPGTQLKYHLLSLAFPRNLSKVETLLVIFIVSISGSCLYLS